MNRYAATGMMLDALDGKTILVLVHPGPALRAAMDEVRAVLPDDPDTFELRRTNGAEQIRLPSGSRIRFTHHHKLDALRGMSADVVYLDPEVDRQLTVHQWNDLRAAVRPSGEIIRA